MVDDGSTDATMEVVSSITDARLRLIRSAHQSWRGTARNLGADSARGEWIVWLDSDDELTADALESMEREIGRAGGDVDACRFMCRLDSGAQCPARPFGRDVWDYEGYVRWLNPVGNGGLKETLLCVRRRTFAQVRCPDSGFGTLYHLDFSVRFKTATSPVVVRLYHSTRRPIYSATKCSLRSRRHPSTCANSRPSRSARRRPTRWAPGAAFMPARPHYPVLFCPAIACRGFERRLDSLAALAAHGASGWCSRSGCSIAARWRWCRHLGRRNS